MTAGEITTTSLLDREAKSEYILIVRAVDGGVGHHQKTGIAMVSVGRISISSSHWCPAGAGTVESCSVSFSLCEEHTMVPALCTTPAAAHKEQQFQGGVDLEISFLSWKTSHTGAT